MVYHEKVLESERIANYELKKALEKGIKKFRIYSKEENEVFRKRKIEKN